MKKPDPYYFHVWDPYFNFLFQIQMLKRGKTLFEYSVTVDLRRQMPGNVQVIEPLHPKPHQQSHLAKTSRVICPLKLEDGSA